MVMLFRCVVETVHATILVLVYALMSVVSHNYDYIHRGYIILVALILILIKW